MILPSKIMKKRNTSYLDAFLVLTLGFFVVGFSGVFCWCDLLFRNVSSRMPITHNQYDTEYRQLTLVDALECACA